MNKYKALKTINIDGTTYGSNNLSRLHAKSDLHKECALFLTEWFNQSDDIVAKTSGTTGAPKNIALKKDAMIASAGKTCDFFNLTNSSTALLALSPKYIAGKMMLVRAMVADLKLLVTHDMANPLKSLTHNIDFVALVPLQLGTALPNKANFEKVKTILIGGAPLSLSTVNQIQSIPSQIYHSYGMTETASHVAIKPLNGSGKSDFFTALSNVSFSTNNLSQLIISAPGIIDEPLITNDIVRLIDSSRFQWLGRKDNVINSGGLKFFPEKIEHKLSPFIESLFYISSEEDPKLGEKIVLVTEKSNSQSDEQLKALFKVNLAPYERPKNIRRVASIRLTKNGKVIRQ